MSRLNVFSCRQEDGSCATLLKVRKEELYLKLKKVREFKRRLDICFGRCEEQGDWNLIPWEVTLTPATRTNDAVGYKWDKDHVEEVFRLDDRTPPSFDRFVPFGVKGGEARRTKEYPGIGTVLREVRKFGIRVKTGLETGDFISI